MYFLEDQVRVGEEDLRLLRAAHALVDELTADRTLFIARIEKEKEECDNWRTRIGEREVGAATLDE